MALLRAKWLAMGVPVGFWWGWKKRNVWELDKMVESVLPRPVAKHVVELLPKGTADTRRKVRLQESITEDGRRQEETIRKLEETIRRQDENAARMEENNRLLRTVIARLPAEASEHPLAQKQGGSPAATTTTPASPTKQ